MSKKSRPDPKYRLHKQSGQAVVTLPDGMGGRRDVLLGKHGTMASHWEYERVLADWKARNQGGPDEEDDDHDKPTMTRGSLRGQRRGHGHTS